MSRTLLGTLLLTLTLLLSQLGGISHALSHKQADADTPPAACALCAAYAAFDHAHVAPGLHTEANPVLPVAEPLHQTGGGQSFGLAYHSRAPPACLV